MPDPRFVIGGTEYPVPTRSSLDLDEHVIFYDWTGMHLEGIDEVQVNALMIGAFMQIAYLRANPDVSPSTARKIVGKSNYEAALAALTEEDEESPPAQSLSEKEPPARPENSVGSPSISGPDSTTLSDLPANGHSSGGAPVSGMSVMSGQTK